MTALEEALPIHAFVIPFIIMKIFPTKEEHGHPWTQIRLCGCP